MKNPVDLPLSRNAFPSDLSAAEALSQASVLIQKVYEATGAYCRTPSDETRSAVGSAHESTVVAQALLRHARSKL